jgi:hypothetical protein
LHNSILEWLRSHEILLGWLSAISVFTFVGSLIAVPWMVVRIPADYFVHRRHFVDRLQTLHPVLRVALLVLKNLCGVLLVLAGVAMLVLPGQGILTILLGLMCLDFPGKFTLERRLARQPPVMRSLNWIRAKAHRPPLQIGTEAPTPRPPR